MSEESIVAIVVAILGSTAAIAAAAIAAHQAHRARKANRSGQIEAQLRHYSRDNALLYLWNRELVDHIYRRKAPPPPGPPPGLFINERTIQ